MRELVQRAARSIGLSFSVALLVGTTAPNASAQIAPQLGLGGALEVGGEAERYLRALQLAGGTPLVGWTSHPFAPEQESLLVPRGRHPWEKKFAPLDSISGFRWLRPSAHTVLNSTFPVQEAVGPAWAGRGATLILQAGFGGRWSALEYQLAPVAFLAQNASFPLADNKLTGKGAFADPRFPVTIDAPQRFGDKAYGRIDAGTSFLRLNLPYVTAGASNAPQRWGPARDYPLVLGPAAGGFPHGFVGTNGPISLGFAHVNAKLVAGPLTQSDYSAATADHSTRFASAAVVSLSPRGVTGLELGATRFFESFRSASFSRVIKPLTLTGLVGAQGDTIRDNIGGENQMVSVFFRWAFAPSGFEVYGEWYREDFPGDFRKLVLKPDDLMSYMFGMQRVLKSTAQKLRVFRFELVNGELSHQERGQRGAFAPLPPYVHFEVVQGHTQYGRILGSEEAFGGSGWRLGVDDFTSTGRRSLGIERALRLDYLSGALPSVTEVHPDVLYSLRWEQVRFAGARDYTLAVMPSVDLNRDLQRGEDRLNLQVILGVRGWR